MRDAVGPDYVLMYDPWGTYMTMEETDPGSAASSRSAIFTGTSTRCPSTASRATFGFPPPAGQRIAKPEDGAEAQTHQR